MALLPDLVTAGGVALLIFLLTLGILVVFVEAVPRRVLVAVPLAAVVLASLLVLAGDLGTAVLALAFGAALVAKGAFEWLTMR